MKTNQAAIVQPSAADQIARLRHALEVARHRIEADRMALVVCHSKPGSWDVTDELGKQGLQEYDDTLAVINNALKTGPESEGGEA